MEEMSLIFGLEDVGGKQADGSSERNGKLQPNILSAIEMKSVLSANEELLRSSIDSARDEDNE